MASNGLTISPGVMPVPQDDPSLAQRLARGDEAAFDQVVNLHSRDVARLARRLLGWRHVADVQDVTQEVFVKVYLKRHKFRGESSLRTWLVRITINCVRSHQRRRMLLLEPLWRRQPAAAPAPEADLVVSERIAQTRAAVQRLVARDREVVVLHYLEELPVEAVAEITGSTPGAVMVRLHRARKRLAELLGSGGPGDE